MAYHARSHRKPLKKLKYMFSYNKYAQGPVFQIGVSTKIIFNAEPRPGTPKIAVLHDTQIQYFNWEKKTMWG